MIIRAPVDRMRITGGGYANDYVETGIEPAISMMRCFPCYSWQENLRREIPGSGEQQDERECG
jgi:hypothetical protein